MATKPEKTEKATELSVEDVSKQIAEMLSEARKEAAKIIAEAKAKATGEMTEEEKQKKADRDAYWNELVEIQLFKDNDKYKDDVLVSVNDEHILIKRGEKVKIKRKFENALDISDKQNFKADTYIEQKSKERPVIAEM